MSSTPNLTEVWQTVARTSEYVNVATVEEHLSKISEMHKAGQDTQAIVHCDVMDTLWSRDGQGLNYGLVALLKKLKELGYEIKIVSNNPALSNDYIGDLDVVQEIASVTDFGGDENLTQIGSIMYGDNAPIELIIDDQEHRYKNFKDAYANRIHPKDLIL